MPWGERKHGPMGLVQSYQKLLKTKDPQHTILLMKKIIMNGIDRMDKCPCGSGLLFKKCHRTIITKLCNHLPKGQLNLDFMAILGG